MLAIAVAVAAFAVPASATAATVSLGETSPLGITGGCSGCSFFQRQTDSASPSYTVPGGGPWTITSWSARGGTIDDAARLLVFRATGPANQFQLVAQSPESPIPANGAPVIPVSVPVQSGDLLGLHTGGGDMPARHPSFSSADQFAGVAGNVLLGDTVGPGGMHFYGTNSNERANLLATLFSPDPAKKKKCKKKRKKKGKGKAAAAKKKKKCKKKKRKK
jgi:hypothetical protein